MTPLFLERMQERADRGRSDSDLTYFHDLLLFGEMALKLTVLGMIAGIADDKNRLRYAALHSVVRANGLGEWVETLDDVLAGPPSQFLLPAARTEQRELTEKFAEGTWQHDAPERLRACIREIDPDIQPLPTRIDARRWCHLFVRLRNKTRGHGALGLHVISSMCEDLEASVFSFVNNFHLFKREWAYLHRNLSGKYRVLDLGNGTDAFDHLKSSKDESHLDGVHIGFGDVVLVPLLGTSVDLNDFYLPNGDFTDKQFECISYITGDNVFHPSKDYLSPVGPLPESETDGLGQLSLEGYCFGNLPPQIADYVSRPELETELQRILMRSDQHPVVTLYGGGGIGKTSLALHVAHGLTSNSTYALIVWFSARDIDLLAAGPKLVRPKVLTIKDMAKDYVELLEPKESAEKAFDAVGFLADHMRKPVFGATLFVLDNFETVTNPLELYTWIDTYIRLPNKVLVTTRHREFKGDYPIKVDGMKDNELSHLIDVTANRLGIVSLLTSDYIARVRAESDGHPYVAKMLLGDVARSKKLARIERIIAGSDDILAALFERTYTKLSPAAQRCFLSLCGWRSTIPVVAVEAVVLQSSEERFNVRDAIDELDNYSFIELARSENDNEEFITVPFVAAIFGQQKLSVHPLKQKITNDTELLQQFGGGQPVDVRHGIGPRIGRIIKFVARETERDHELLLKYVPMLEFLARRHPLTWLSLAQLYFDLGSYDDLTAAKDCIRHFLETAAGEEALQAWRWLIQLCRETNDLVGEVHALLEICEHHDLPFNDISNVANRLNTVFAGGGMPHVDLAEKRALFERLAEIMVERLHEANATDLSRLAWLYLNRSDEVSARHYTRLGLAKDPDNWYCRKLATHLKIVLEEDLDD